MKVTILGCGGSAGVPLVDGDWGACDPANPRNRRRRVSVLVEDGETSLLVDTSPDLREQLLAAQVRHLSAVFYTHAHADHCHGIDDLKVLSWRPPSLIPAYGDAKTLGHLQHRFPYAWPAEQHPLYKPFLEARVIQEPVRFGSVTVTPFHQEHGPHESSLGYRFNDFAYSTDASHLDDAAFAALKGVRVWVVDCVREKPHPTHAHLERTLEWIARVKPERAYLTHMDQSMDYDTVMRKLPAGVEPAYDGLVIAC